MPTPKEQCEQLLDLILPLAEKLLVEHAEFYPFGASLKIDGTQVSISAQNGDKMPRSQPLIEILRDGLREFARKGEIVASAIAYDVRVTTPGSGAKTDALAIEFEHKDDYTMLVYFPYRLKAKTVVFGEAFANSNTRYVFAYDA